MAIGNSKQSEIKMMPFRFSMHKIHLFTFNENSYRIRRLKKPWLTIYDVQGSAVPMVYRT